jgi:effector-binding domain-containing protein
MKQKTAPAMTVLAYELKTTMNNLINDVGTIPKEIFKSAVDNGLHPAGPQYWIYSWENGNADPEAEFKLSICLPVATFGTTYNQNKFQLLNLDAFKHVSMEHLGSWADLKVTYGKLMNEMQIQQLVPGSTCREIYINCDFEHLDRNITEVQFEIN